MSVPRYIGGLSKRELEVVGLVCRGMQNKEIGAKLNITSRTVRYHLTSIYEQLGIESRQALLLWAIGVDLVDPGILLQESRKFANAVS